MTIPLGPSHIDSAVLSWRRYELGLGTHPGALLLRAAHRFFAFGPGSCARHQAEAETRGLATVLLPRPGLARDLDDADDWAAVCAHLGHADLTAADLITHLATSH